MGNKTNQFSRIVDIACNLNLHRKAGLSPEDMAVQYGVSSRTIRRDINTLQDLGVQVELEGGRFYLVGSFLPPVTIFPSEATVILMGLRLLASNANAYYEAGFADAMRKEVIVVAKSLGELKFDVANRHTITHGGDPALLATELEKKISALRLSEPLMV